MFALVPIRLRLTATFLAAMLIMLTAGGVVVRATVAHSIDRSIDAGLRSRVDDLGATVRTNGAEAASIPPRTLISEENSFAQIVSFDGKLLASSERFAGERILDATRVRAAVKRPTFIDTTDGQESDEIRVLASPERVDGKTVIVLVGVSLDARAQTLHDLTLLLWIGGAAGALIAALIGYLVAGTALRSVDTIRAAADQIDESRFGDRVPVPRARDELQRLSLTLNELLQRIERAFDYERKFIAHASHELRTPIAIIKSELELALATSITPSNFSAAIDRIHSLERRIESAESETDRLGQLATALLHGPRPQGDDDYRIPLSLTDVNLHSILDSVQHRFAERARRNDRPIDHDRGSGAAVYARIDALRIEQAVANLVENSLQHGAGDIRLTVDDSIDAARIVISDHGSGVPLANRFDSSPRSTSLVPRASQQRTGIGLHVVRDIMRAHDGSLEFTDGGMPYLKLPASQ